MSDIRGEALLGPGDEAYSPTTVLRNCTGRTLSITPVGCSTDGPEQLAGRGPDPKGRDTYEIREEPAPPGRPRIQSKRVRECRGFFYVEVLRNGQWHRVGLYPSESEADDHMGRIRTVDCPFLCGDKVRHVAGTHGSTGTVMFKSFVNGLFSGDYIVKVPPHPGAPTGNERWRGVDMELVEPELVEPEPARPAAPQSAFASFPG